MKRVLIKYRNEEYELEELEIKYLFPYFFRFDNKNDTNILKPGKSILSGNLLELFKNCLYEALSRLISDCYRIPALKERQKHPTLFEKFILNGEKYTVNYTTSILGRLIYTLYLRFTFADEAFKSKSELILSVE